MPHGGNGFLAITGRIDLQAGIPCSMPSAISRLITSSLDQQDAAVGIVGAQTGLDGKQRCQAGFGRDEGGCRILAEPGQNQKVLPCPGGFRRPLLRPSGARCGA